jgi:hypothetical protein
MVKIFKFLILKGFLTAIKLIFARNNGIALESVKFKTRIIMDLENTKVSSDENIYRLTGMFIEGASFDLEGVLVD